MLIEEWLEKIIWFMEFEWMVGEIREWVRIGIMEVLMNGFIMINDYYFFVDEIVWEVEKMGVRVFIGQIVMDLVDFLYVDLEEGFKFFRCWQEKSEFVMFIFVFYVINIVSLEFMREMVELLEEINVRIYVYLVQSRIEVKEVKKCYSLNLVEYLK